ncbi:hypothetical protein [Sphingosinicella terrae]|uniref:hypothetical protein n=1 Tax=Sphingosinicella terrae TaxID=2172047 RepID=UPI000E0CFDF0|nr:hypothetical protein [Sphingosinicella terrae]
MPELRRQTALAHRTRGASIRAGDTTLREPIGLRAILVTSRTQICLPGAIHLGPGEWLMVGDDEEARAALAAAAGTALLQDMSAGLAVIEAEGPDVLDAIGLSSLTAGIGGALTTRLADLRVTVEYRRGGRHWARFIVDRFSADYLWAWLVARLDAARVDRQPPEAG